MRGKRFYRTIYAVFLLILNITYNISTFLNDMHNKNILRVQGKSVSVYQMEKM